MTKIKTQSVLITIGLIVFLAFSSCNKKNPKRDFFVEMKEHYSFQQKEFADIISSVEGFGISQTADCFNDKYYYKINKGMGIQGYLRMEGEKLFLLAIENSNKKYADIDSLKTEQLFLDFSAPENKSWEICYTANVLLCDKITFQGRAFNKKLNDTAYIYRISPLNKLNLSMVSDESELHIFVSKKYGFTTFTCSYGPRGGYEIDLVPLPFVRKN